MNQLLKCKQDLALRSSGTCYIERLLGAGTQGEVYEARFTNQPVALKWYHPQYLSADLQLESRLGEIVAKGAPCDRFLWPVKVVTSPDVQGFGYIMGLREPRFKGIVDLMKRRVEPSFRVIATTAYDLANSYLQLHSNGLCYRDISFGNVFFDPVSGEVRICDNDNVDIDGQRGSISGTPRFMAPELVLGRAAPSSYTDLYSLSVLLFYLLFIHHPLDGAQEAAIKIMDAPAMQRLYGTHPIFVFDPCDATNRPVAGYQDAVTAFWQVYPKSLRDLFTQAFTRGLHDPMNGRVRESSWRQAFSRLRDSIFSCPHCGVEVFYEDDAAESQNRRCWACQRQTGPHYRILIGSKSVTLQQGAKLFPHHVDPRRLYDFSTPVAEVTVHPNDPRIWGLKNLSDSSWTALATEGVARVVTAGSSVVIRPGTLINLGNSEGRIQYS